MATDLDDLTYDPNRKLKVVGTNPIKADGVDKVTGRAKFGADTYPAPWWARSCAAPMPMPSSNPSISPRPKKSPA